MSIQGTTSHDGRVDARRTGTSWRWSFAAVLALAVTAQAGVNERQAPIVTEDGRTAGYASLNIVNDPEWPTPRLFTTVNWNNGVTGEDECNPFFLQVGHAYFDMVPPSTDYSSWYYQCHYNTEDFDTTQPHVLDCPFPAGKTITDGDNLYLGFHANLFCEGDNAFTDVHTRCDPEDPSCNFPEGASSPVNFWNFDITLQDGDRSYPDSWFALAPAAASFTVIEDSPTTGILTPTFSHWGPLIYSITTPPTHGTVSLHQESGVFTYTPFADPPGADAFQFTVTDGNTTPAPGTVSLWITPVNRPPSFVAGVDQTTQADAGPQSVSDWASAISAGRVEEAGQELSFVVTENSNSALFAAGPGISPQGTLTYTPAIGAAGSAQVSVVLRDDGGTENGGIDSTEAQTFTITVEPAETIYIPTDTSVGTFDGETYTFTQAVSRPVEIVADGITVSDAVIGGSGTYAVYARDRRDVTVVGLHVAGGYTHGVYIVNTSRDDAGSVHVQQATMDAVGNGVRVINQKTGASYTQILVEDNTITATEDGVLVWIPDASVAGDVAMRRNEVTATTGSLNSQAVYLHAGNTTIVGVAEVADNIVHSAGAGVTLNEVNGAAIGGGLSVSGNAVAGAAPYGLMLLGATGAAITGNDFAGAGPGSEGIRLEGSTGNLITTNTVSGFEHAVAFGEPSSSGNELFRNDLTGYAAPVAGSPGGNSFHRPLPEGGNYWEGWTTPDVDGDGVVDTPYDLGGGAIDAHAHALPVAKGLIVTLEPATTPEDTPLAGSLIVAGTLGAWTVEIVAAPAHGEFSLDASDDSFTYVPDPEFFGTDAFTVSVSDAAGSSQRAMSIEVVPVNDAPTVASTSLKYVRQVAHDGNSESALEAQSTTTVVVPDWAQPGPGNESGQLMTLGIVSNSKPEMFAELPALSPDGGLSYRIAADFWLGTAEFVLEVQDDGGTTSEVSLEIQVRVDAANGVVTPNPAAVGDTVQLYLTRDIGCSESVDGTCDFYRGEIGSFEELMDIDLGADDLQFTGGEPVYLEEVYPPSDDESWVPGVGGYYVTPYPFTLSPSEAEELGDLTYVIRAVVPPGARDGQVEWIVGNTTYFHVAPTVSSVSPGRGGPGVQVRLAGSGFGELQSVRLGGADCEIVASDHDFIDILIPEGASSGVLLVTTADGTSSSPEAFVLNLPPNSVPAELSTGEDQVVSGVLLASDPEGDAFVFEIVDPPTHGQVVLDGSSTGAYTYTPAGDYFGPDSFTFRASDGGPAEGRASVTIDIVSRNDPPTFTIGGDQTVAADAGGQTVPDWFTDPSPGPANESAQTLAPVELSTNAGALFGFLPTVHSDGTLIYAPLPGPGGTATVTVRLRDDGGTDNGGIDVSEQSFTITILPSDGPPAAGVTASAGSVTTLEDTPVSGTLTGSGGDGSPLSFAISGEPARGTLALDDPATGAFTYTPFADASGADAFTFTATDGGSISAPATVTVDVTPVNDAPSFLSGANQATEANAGPQSVPNWASAVSAGPADEAGQSLAFVVTDNTNPGLFADGPSLASDGTLSYESAPMETGSATITLVLQDDGGTVDGGVDVSASHAFVINIGSADQFVSLQLSDSHGNAIRDAGVTLLLESGASTGVQTATCNLGLASFAIDVDASYRFKVTYNGGSFTTDPVTPGGEVPVQTRATTLTLTDAQGNPVAGAHVDLLRANESNTDVSADTDASGVVAFEVLPGFEHRFKVRHNGQSYVTGIAPEDGNMAYAIQVQAPTVSLELTDSDGAPIAGQRVDLLRANGSSTGVKTNTDDQGKVRFDVVPDTESKLKVYHNGGTYATAAIVVGGSVAVQTERSQLTLMDADGAGIAGQRVDLLRANGSSTGVKVNTDDQGVGGFEILPAYAHQFKVYHNGGTWVSAAVTAGDDATVSTQLSTLNLIDADGSAIAGQRVDLLRANSSSTGVKANTDEHGDAAFQILPDYVHRFKIYHNGGTHLSAELTFGDDAVVQTERSSLTLTGSGGAPIEGQRVDLLRANDSSTGVKVNTGADGVSGFQILPGYVHKFKVYHNGGTWVSSEVTAGEDAVVETERSSLTLTDSDGAPIEGQRVDLLRANDSSTGVKVNTDAAGASAFEILPGYVHKFKVYHSGGTWVGGERIGGQDEAVQTELSTLTVTSGGTPVEGLRVDLLRANGSNTGVKVNTDASGVSGFQILPDYVHILRAYLSPAALDTEELIGGQDAVLDLATAKGVGALALADRPSEFGLGDNFPNPFNPSTTIPYTLDELSPVRIVIYNALGQQVRELVDHFQAPGNYRAEWDGRDASGQPVTSGVYLYRIEAGARTDIRKMLFAQ